MKIISITSSVAQVSGTIAGPSLVVMLYGISDEGGLYQLDGKEWKFVCDSPILLERAK